MENSIKLFVAAKALIVNDEGKVLVVRAAADNESGLYELVGGRVEPGEPFAEVLPREIKEETGLEVDIIKPITVTDWRRSRGNEEWQVIAIFFECTYRGGEVILSGDHNDYKWIDPKEYQRFPLMENLKAVFEAYNNR